jgi:hypothetical protein
VLGGLGERAIAGEEGAMFRFVASTSIASQPSDVWAYVSDLPFDGLLVHLAGQGKKGFCVVDVFASQSAVNAFNEALGSVPGGRDVPDARDHRSAFTDERRRDASDPVHRVAFAVPDP